MRKSLHRTFGVYPMCLKPICDTKTELDCQKTNTLK